MHFNGMSNIKGDFVHYTLSTGKAIKRQRRKSLKWSYPYGQRMWILLLKEVFVLTLFFIFYRHWWKKAHRCEKSSSEKCVLHIFETHNCKHPIAHSQLTKYIYIYFGKEKDIEYIQKRISYELPLLHSYIIRSKCNRLERHQNE